MFRRPHPRLRGRVATLPAVQLRSTPLGAYLLVEALSGVDGSGRLEDTAVFPMPGPEVLNARWVGSRWVIVAGSSSTPWRDRD